MSKVDENLIEIEEDQLRDITDLFFFNEKIKDDQSREVMVVELKRPSCKITQKELNQLDRYRFHIEENEKYCQEIFFKIILISSDLNKYSKSTIGNIDPKNPYLFSKNKKGNIETWVIKWADLIHINRKKLSYMGNELRTKDQSIKDIFNKEYSDINISNLISTMIAAK